MKGSAMVYGRQTWESLTQLTEMKEDIYNKILEKDTIKDPEYIYIDI